MSDDNDDKLTAKERFAKNIKNYEKNPIIMNNNNRPFKLPHAASSVDISRTNKIIESTNSNTNLKGSNSFLQQQQQEQPQAPSQKPALPERIRKMQIKPIMVTSLSELISPDSFFHSLPETVEINGYTYEKIDLATIQYDPTKAPPIAQTSQVDIEKLMQIKARFEK